LQQQQQQQQQQEQQQQQQHNNNNNNNNNNNFWQYANTFVEIAVNLKKRNFIDEVKFALSTFFWNFTPA
jgi:hypothetical protein